ncbi:U1biquitin-specific peptidase-like protein [Xylogone sp. PMI_703]|nr:U1biquitin-specific peptidase-like protein [Xylogone sp. PMI_703]
MPDKQLTIATYAAGASLAAITLVYVFAPTFFIDGESTGAPGSRRKGVVVGLSNPANDCFINSVLQALAGLGDLRRYLIRETHRRKLESEIYAHLVEDPSRKNLPAWKIEGLQAGLVTQGLKDILDALNERPLSKKTISAAPFVVVLERAFRQRISRQQQDAQEFLQVVAERLCDEYHAGRRARQFARNSASGSGLIQPPSNAEESTDQKSPKLAAVENENIDDEGPAIQSESPSNPQDATVGIEANEEADDEPEDGFPFEGTSESQIECLTCGFKPKATQSTFCALTLSVPQVSSTSLNACFDQMFKIEYIEDFKCEKCRLVHGLQTLRQELEKSKTEESKAITSAAIERLQLAIETNPEDPPEDINMPDRKLAPKRKIAKYVRITKFPKIMAIHLSRSIFDSSRSTMKNSAKVAFPERLSLGGLLDRKSYKLLSVVCHKGSHHSGHYESFRRQAIHAPFSTPNTFKQSVVYSKPSTPIPSQISTPQIKAIQKLESQVADTGSTLSTPELLSPASAASTTSLPSTNGSPTQESIQIGNSVPKMRSPSTVSSGTSRDTSLPGPTSAPRDPDTGSLSSINRPAREMISKAANSVSRPHTRGSIRGRSKKKSNDRWWRISDDNVKECKTSQTLGMQREVYMLFYEMEPCEDD